MIPKQAYDKCKGEINKKLEPYFIKDSYWAYRYARDNIKGRWIEAEQYIINDSQITFWYAEDIIKGKLPENMHNMMLIHADHHAKYYFDYIKNKHQP
jgi:hypothetical protein